MLRIYRGPDGEHYAHVERTYVFGFERGLERILRKAIQNIIFQRCHLQN